VADAESLLHQNHRLVASARGGSAPNRLHTTTLRRVGTMPRSSPAPSRSFLIVEFRLCREDSTTTGALARRPPSRGAAARRRCGDAAAATGIRNFSFGGANSSRRDGCRPLNRSHPASTGSSAISRDEASSSSPPSLPPGTSSKAVAASAEPLHLPPRRRRCAKRQPPTWTSRRAVRPRGIVTSTGTGQALRRDNASDRPRLPRAELRCRMRRSMRLERR
jgi:hypothetical protein